ncbi:hypothetical protein [Paracidovorax oryzae]|uniref:hypothetical protein n=1 Tax=Paracidovorax oryzae TaxID=862720 RepID=UPI0035CFE520
MSAALTCPHGVIFSAALTYSSNSPLSVTLSAIFRPLALASSNSGYRRFSHADAHIRRLHVCASVCGTFPSCFSRIWAVQEKVPS